MTSPGTQSCQWGARARLSRWEDGEGEEARERKGARACVRACVRTSDICLLTIGEAEVQGREGENEGEGRRDGVRERETE